MSYLFLILAMLVLSTAGIQTESNSASDSHSKSHHSKSHHSHSHRSHSHNSRSESTSHNSQSHSTSHESQSLSMSQSESFPFFPDAVTCSSVIAVPDEYALRFPALVYENDETCKGKDYLHDGNAKNWPTHAGLGETWQSRRECICTSYRVCVNHTECSLKPKHFNLSVVLTNTSVNVDDGAECNLLPYVYVALPPNLLAQPNIPVPLKPSISCVFVDSCPYYIFNTTLPFYISPSYGTGNSAACTTVSSTLSHDNQTRTVVMTCVTNSFDGCTDPIPLQTNFTSDVLRTGCNHVKTTGTPNNGAGKVTAWVFTGVFGILLIAGLIIWFVSIRRRDNYFLMRRL